MLMTLYYLLLYYILTAKAWCLDQLPWHFVFTYTISTAQTFIFHLLIYLLLHFSLHDTQWAIFTIFILIITFVSNFDIEN